MSRIGKKPVIIPKGVDVELSGDILKVKGPKGELKKQIHPRILVKIDGDILLVSTADQSKKTRSFHGLFNVLISNMITGVTKGFDRKLEIIGVGYRAEMKGSNVVFNLGYSHPVDFEIPEGIEVKIDKTKITLTGIDKDLLGLTAARIRSLKKPEPYKGKGIKYAEETIRRKAGKTGIK